MIKRFLTVVLFACMALCSVIPFASAGEAKDTAATSGVDVVVVLDMSQSMKNPNNNANAKNNDSVADAAGLTVKLCVLDESVRMRRYWPTARGSAHPIARRMCHCKVILAAAKKAKKGAK